MTKNTKIWILSFLVISISTYFFANYTSETKDFSSFKYLFTQDQRHFVKKYFFPYRAITDHEKTISQNEKRIAQQQKIINTTSLHAELFFKETLRDIKTKKTENILLSNNYKLKKFVLTEGFYSGIRGYPGSGFIDSHLDNLLVLSSRGVLGYSKYTEDLLTFKQIKNNIDDFIGLDQFNKSPWFSIKDLTIHKNKILISYAEEIKKDCWNTSIILGEINYENIVFKKLFSPRECIHSLNNIDDDFNGVQSGGRIVSYDGNHIFFSIGDYRNRFLSQREDSVNGKIIKININNADYEIISMGHRNPQGLFYDKENNILLETEHGPHGGDEINLIEFDELLKSGIPNFGWPIASYGEHYPDYTEQESKILYTKYPLYKSHIAHGFIEPLKSFVPSIGISQIVKIGENRYVAASLMDSSLNFFQLNKENKIEALIRVEVFERVRDMIYLEDKIYLFLEDSPSIAILKID
tara:strand:+ start:201 stop:1601 length:1401 start_codon:yes stop_codon:yes gene_type:complete